MGITLEKIDEYRFRIPRQGKMRTDGIIYANERMIELIKQDQSLNQVANVACLPGIVGPSMAMPDIHSGYGFPIGGVAAFDLKEGIISPGGVGYDINCIHPDETILTVLGCQVKIKNWQGEDLLGYGQNIKKMPVLLHFSKKYKNILNIKTKLGYRIRVSPDHPILTPHGMCEAKALKIRDKIAVYGFTGVPYEPPQIFEIISNHDLKSICQKYGFSEYLIKILERKGLCPLKSDHPLLPYILKIMGYLTGDGTLILSRGRLTTWYYGQSEDLESIRQDVIKIGYTPSRIYKRKRQHTIQTKYKRYNFFTEEAGFNITARGLNLLLLALGIPLGNKAKQDYGIPDWIKQLPLWMKRLYLSCFFGAELTSPKAFNGYNFYMPTISLNKKLKVFDRFLKDIKDLIKSFGIKVSEHLGEIERDYVNQKGQISKRYRLFIKADDKNLLNLYQKVGYEYAIRKQFLATNVVYYLKLKQSVLAHRQRVADDIKILKQLGYNHKAICAVFRNELELNRINHRFLERHLWEKTQGVKPPLGFIKFEDFVQENNAWIYYDIITDIQKSPYDGLLYDFTIDHPAHNFIANNIVVSNCGVRLLSSNLTKDEVEKDIKRLTDTIFVNVPSGVGSRRKDFRLNQASLRHVLNEGAGWAIRNGFGTNEDLGHIEEKGCLPNPNPDFVSKRALERGKDQLGTLGSGNHFVEIGYVERVYNEKVAHALGLFKGEVTILIHTGSRGLGHQVCDDYIKVLLKSSARYGIELPDKQLCCAPISSEEGQQYLSAMACAANFAFTNRQLITHWVRETFEKSFKKSSEDLGLFLIYDVCHNIAKIETHEYQGKKIKLCVHRKGATRAFPLGHPDVPRDYKEIGQPVLIPGDMGRYSYVLVGTKGAMEETFGSTCHGAGRVMSRKQAKKIAKGRDIEKEMSKKGIYVRGAGRGTLVEEISEAYKDVADVIEAVDGAGISHKVVRLKPLGVVKG